MRFIMFSGGVGEVSLAVGAASAALESWGVLRALKRVQVMNDVS